MGKRSGESGPPDELFTATQAAAYKRVRRSTIYKAIKEGRLVPFRPERPFLIRRDVLDGWMPLSRGIRQR